MPNASASAEILSIEIFRFPALDLREIGLGKPCLMGKSFLAQPSFASQSTKIAGEFLARFADQMIPLRRVAHFGSRQSINFKPYSALERFLGADVVREKKIDQLIEIAKANSTILMELNAKHARLSVKIEEISQRLRAWRT